MLTVARVLLGIISQHRVPCILHSNQGRPFENDVIHELCRLLGIKKVRISPYHPGGGLAERMSRNLLQMLSRYVAETQWNGTCSCNPWSELTELQSSCLLVHLLLPRCTDVNHQHQLISSLSTQFDNRH